ncbi:hypothetical protein B0H10DRAFT_2315135 [Mycena sp. CBHHK59/15]|nr:hypothetical protein B0H10DRAFT_2315135 [Mycena sp. CBHHK59/15]
MRWALKQPLFSVFLLSVDDADFNSFNASVRAVRKLRIHSNHWLSAFDRLGVYGCLDAKAWINTGEPEVDETFWLASYLFEVLMSAADSEQARMGDGGLSQPVNMPLVEQAYSQHQPTQIFRHAHCPPHPGPKLPTECALTTPARIPTYARLQDPLMARFPFVLAIKPRLLPYAVANEFQMDSKYRDFVFCKVFEHSAVVLTTPAANAAHVDEIVSDVKELCRLEPARFVTHTVAAEVCLVAKTNELAYSNRFGHLPFCAVLSLKARGITTTAITQVLTVLYTDLLALPPVPVVSASSARHALPPPPARAPVDPTMHCDAAQVVRLKARPAALRLGELSRRDAVGVLCSPFVERYAPVADYLRRETGFSHAQLKELVEEVAMRCPEIEGEGKTLKKLSEAFPGASCMRCLAGMLYAWRTCLTRARRRRAWPSDGGNPRRQAGQRLGDGGRGRDEEEDADDASSSGNTEFGRWRARRGGSGPADEDESDEDESDEDSTAGAKRGVSELGSIGLENLMTTIRRDVMQPRRVRRWTPSDAHTARHLIPLTRLCARTLACESV